MIERSKYMNIDAVLNALSHSKFRSSFHLKDSDIDYIDAKGFDIIEKHAYDFLNSRLRVKLSNDGKQTPYKGHPVFIAEHATATCCRGCVAKWYKFSETQDLTDDQIDYLVRVIMTWIKREYDSKKRQ